MFGWFKKKRSVYSYSDGARTRYIDPVLVIRSLDGIPGFNEDLTIIDKPDEFGRAAYEKCLAAVRQVFAIAPLGPDGSGLTEGETWDVFNGFSTFIGEVKKNTPTSRDLPLPTQEACESTNSPPTPSSVSG